MFLLPVLSVRGILCECKVRYSRAGAECTDVEDSPRRVA